MAASNPILTGFNPDPSVLRVGDDYFIATSTFEYFPGVPIYHSKDLVNWKLIGHALNRRSQLDMRTVEPGAGVWAPCLRYWKGRFYLATCCVYLRSRRPIQPRGFYVSTDDIFDQTKWSEPVDFDMIGIDQDMFFDDDDRVYLSVSRFSVSSRQHPGSKLITYASEIDLKTGSSIGPVVALRTSKERLGVAEGPHIYKYGGWYYLVTAEGGTGPGHRVWITRSQNPLGPYEEAPEGVNPLVFNGEDPAVQRTGHADLVQGPDGKWWAVLLGVRTQATGLAHLGRETFLAPVEWEEGGWPTINQGRPIGLPLPEYLPKVIEKPKVWRDDFDKGELDMGWYNLRTPIKPFHTFDSRPGCLTLTSNGMHIEQLECPAMLLRKQTAYTGKWSTKLHFEPESEFDQAGTTVYYSAFSFAAIYITKEDGRLAIVARWTDHESRTIQKISRPLQGSGPVVLAIDARPTTFSLRYSEGSSTDDTELVRVSSKVLDGGSPAEYEMYFTGAHFGLFAQTTDGEPCRQPAHFEYAEFNEEVNSKGQNGSAPNGNGNGHGHGNGLSNGHAE